MRKFAVTLALATTVLAGVASAADLPKSLKSVTNPIKSLDRLSQPNDVPNVADLINANKIDGTMTDPTTMDDRFYVNSDSQSDGTFSLEVQKRLLEF